MSRAFLLGAGATRARYGNAPLSNDFLEKLMRKHVGLFNSIEKSLHGHVDKNNPLDEMNIEKVMTLAYTLEEENKNALLQCVYSAIYELLAETTESTEEHIYTYLTGKRMTEPPLLRTLLVDKKRLTRDDFFMTLNYDLYLDREIISVNGGINYGLNEGYRQVNSGREYSAYRIPVSSDGLYPVYHLHGSLNWENTLNGHKIIIYPGAIRPLYNGEETNLCLMPPGIKELSPILKVIWENAEHKLLKSDELIIIGCSLNPEDKKLIDLIRTFRDKKGINKIKIIHYIPGLSGEEYTDLTFENIIGVGYKGYGHGFNLNGPSRNTPGAIKFIFS